MSAADGTASSTLSISASGRLEAGRHQDALQVQGDGEVYKMQRARSTGIAATEGEALAVFRDDMAEHFDAVAGAMRYLAPLSIVGSHDDAGASGPIRSTPGFFPLPVAGLPHAAEPFTQQDPQMHTLPLRGPAIQPAGGLSVPATSVSTISTPDDHAAEAETGASAESSRHARPRLQLDASSLLGASSSSSPIGVYSERHAGGQAVWLAVPAEAGGTPLLVQVPAIVAELQRVFAARGERLWRVVCNGSTVWENDTWIVTGGAQDDGTTLHAAFPGGRSFPQHYSMER